MSNSVVRFRYAEGGLSTAMRQAFDRDGFLILEEFASPAACDRLIARAAEMVGEFELGDVATIFSGRSQTHAADDYFRTSGDKIRFFFEPDAFAAGGELVWPKPLAINKIGHALHDLDPVFDQFSRRPALAALVAGLGLARPQLLQSMYIFKQPRIGGEVGCHQDCTFLHTEPLSCIGFWFALQDATLDNGCLWAIPGQHPLRQRFRYRGDELAMETLDSEPWPIDEALPLPAAKGTMIVLDGLLPHFSRPNKSPDSRHAYTLHLVDGASRYSPDNWLRRAPEMPLRGF